MKLQDNPLLKQEDYAAQYNENIEKLRNNPELVAFDKLCYELFYMNELGIEFLKVITERSLIPPMANRDSPHFSTMAVWAEGFKDCIRVFRSAGKSHEQRIKTGENK